MDQQVNILFAGDFAACGEFEAIVIKRKESIFGDALPIIKSADISFVNLECPLTTCAKPIAKIGPALKARFDCVHALRHFSVIGLANNHILDYGREGLNDTIEACRSQNLPTVGAGLSLKDAQKAHITETKGVKVAILALAEREFNRSEGDEFGAALIDVIGNYNQIRQAKTEADVVLVTLHCGNENFPYPRPGLRKLCRHYIDIGAEAIICHHPHVPGAYEYYKGKPIVYSLGNLIFSVSDPEEDWDLGYMARLSIDCIKKSFGGLELIPYKQSVTQQGVRVLTGRSKKNFLARIEEYREKLGNEMEWLAEWERLVKEKADTYIFMQYFPIISKGSWLFAKNSLSNLLYNKSNRALKLNMIRCQSHLELLTSILEKRR
jgi:poly-gamma-glutamate synthesis protein (capsule biosynthesis protein)